MLKVGIFGGTGRVGKLLIEEIKVNPAMTLANIYMRSDSVTPCDTSLQQYTTKDLSFFLSQSEIVIDFSSAQATQMLLEHAQDNPVPLVIGTTGLNKQQMQLLEKSGKNMPILYATNMSEGVAMLNKVIAMTALKLRNYDIEITEIHHKNKKDAPSGTALTLANTVLNARGLDSQLLKFGREGIEERQKDEIGVLSLRGGDVVGRHTVGFYANGEYLEFTHNATSRMTFAKGALRAALWLINQPNGLYSIQDIFDL